MNGESCRAAPLEGVTVIDLTRVLAGPYLTMILADLGACVIKVELPGRGDDARQFGPFQDQQSIYFASINRGKKSIALNLKDADDRVVFEKLLLSGDVLVENFRAGALHKLGYGWQELHRINSRLIYACVSGFGHTGPYRERPAYDLVVQGMGGVMSLTGDQDTAPNRVGTSVGDITAGLFGVSGVLAALYDRERTGEGQQVDVAMLDCQVAILENSIARYFAEDKIPEPIGMRHPSITPFAGFRAKGDEYIIIAVGNDAMFRKFCEVIGREDLLRDSRFRSNNLRTENYQPLHDEIERSLKSRAVAQWLALLQEGGIPCGPINNIEQVVNDPHIRHRNMIISVADHGADAKRNVQMPGNPIKFSGYDDPKTRRRAPRLDEHRQQILEFLQQE